MVEGLSICTFPRVMNPAFSHGCLAQGASSPPSSGGIPVVPIAIGLILANVLIWGLLPGFSRLGA